MGGPPPPTTPLAPLALAVHTAQPPAHFSPPPTSPPPTSAAPAPPPLPLSLSRSQDQPHTPPYPPPPTTHHHPSFNLISSTTLHHHHASTSSSSLFFSSHPPPPQIPPPPLAILRLLPPLSTARPPSSPDPPRSDPRRRRRPPMADAPASLPPDTAQPLGSLQAQEEEDPPLLLLLPSPSLPAPPSSSPSPPPQSPMLAAAAAAAGGGASPALAQNTITLAQPAITNPRRLPPPCWSHDETVALIDAYRDKWYSLRRGNLKANHWQEVADAVSTCCPSACPAKTAVQCRHKMEKLRKRYRAELQRARSIPVSRFISSWVHFKRMDSMEKGHAALNPASATVAKAEKPDSDDDNFNDEDEDEDDSEFLGSARNIHGLYHNGIGTEPAGGSKSGSGFRIKIPTGVSIAQPGVNYRKFDKKFNMGPAASDVNPNFGPNIGPNFGGSVGGGSGGYGARVMREVSGMGKRGREKDPLEEMVGAIKVLGDGFVRMEQMKMEMAREIESMRMEMEMKRTEMILESQQRIVEAFAKAVAERKKKAKRMPTPEA
ncbi:hypothetical protein NL676_009376 [Syzygium grande]|nr:hypothetical protein NL676_009376 [Syzygium grande]